MEAVRGFFCERIGKIDKRTSIKKYAETDITKPECFFVDRPAIKEMDSCINVGLISLLRFFPEEKLDFDQRGFF